MLTKMCLIREDSGQEVQRGTDCITKRTVAFAVVSLQARFASPAPKTIVPEDGLEMKMKQLLLQPLGQTAKSRRMGNRTFRKRQQN